MVYLNLDCSTIEEEIIAADGIVEEYIVFDSMLVPTVVAAILKSRHVSICIYIRPLHNCNKTYQYVL